MPQLLRVPEVATGGTDAVLTGWQGSENDAHRRADVLATIETAKAMVEVAAESDGVVVRRLVPEGADVAAGDPIALLAAPGEAVDDVDAALVALGITASGKMSTQSTNAEPTVEVIVEAESPSRQPPAQPPGGQRDPRQPTPSPVANEDDRPAGGAARVFGSPLARRLAREAGLDMSTLHGTGPHGRLLRRDIERAIEDGAQRAPRQVANAAAGDGSKVGAAWTDTAHSRLRLAVAQRLTESKTTVPHFYLRASVRAADLLELRAMLNAGSPAGGAVRVSVNDLIVKAVARAHTLVPEMNVIWTPEAMRTFTAVDIGVAVASPRGLVTPVLRGVERSTITGVAAEMLDLIERSGAGRLQQTELEGGSTTVSNLGALGTKDFTAIINPPQSSIVAVGAARPEPVAVGKKVKVLPILHLTVSIDHRAIDGALGAQWLDALVTTLEHPLQILA